MDTLLQQLDLTAEQFEYQLRRPNSDVRRTLANLQAMCVFPLIARPILQSLLGLDESGFEDFLTRREESVPDFLVAALRPEPS